MEHDEATRLTIADQILVYLDDHPDALDAPEGIEWWLKHGVKSFDPNLVRALDELVSEGLVVKHAGPDGRFSYGLNQERRGEIRVRLARAQRNAETRDPNHDRNGEEGHGGR